MKTITITDELYENLFALANEYHTQNNRCTAMPIYFQVESEIRADDSVNESNICYLTDEGSYLDDLEDIQDFCISNEIDINLREFDFGYTNIENLRIYYYKYEKIYTGFFLTAKDCNNYIMLNRHNLLGRNHRSYCMHGGYKTNALNIISQFLKELRDE